MRLRTQPGSRLPPLSPGSLQQPPVSGSPRPPSGSVTVGRLLTLPVVVTAMVYSNIKDTKHSWPGGDVLRRPGSSFQSLLLAKSHRMLLIHQLQAVTTRVKCDSTREAHQRLSAQGVYRGLMTWVPSAWHWPEFQTSLEVSLNHTVCTNCQGPASHPYQEMEPPLSAIRVFSTPPSNDLSSPWMLTRCSTNLTQF